MNQKIIREFQKVRRQFPHTKERVYFNTASRGPFAKSVHKAVADNLDLRMYAKHDDSHEAFATADQLRGDFAKLIGANRREVGVGLSTTFGLNIAAYGLPLKRGDEVLVSDVEFPAVVYTWKAAAQTRGLKLKFVKSRDKCFDIDELERAITRRTRVVSLSFVQFFNGFKNDLKTIAEICKKHDIFFVVDGIQGMGAEAINVKKIGIDIFTSGCQKWMLATEGGGFFFLSDRVRDRIVPPFVSWLSVDWQVKFTDLFRYDLPYFDSARRFEMGYLATLNLYAMNAAVKMFQQLGISNIQRHNHTLIDRLADYVRSNPYYRITSSMVAKHRSSIFTFTCDDVVNLHREILRNKIILVRREGSIRVSVHLFNNKSDIDRLKAVLTRFSRRT